MVLLERGVPLTFDDVLRSASDLSGEEVQTLLDAGFNPGKLAGIGQELEDRYKTSGEDEKLADLEGSLAAVEVEGNFIPEDRRYIVLGAWQKAKETQEDGVIRQALGKVTTAGQLNSLTTGTIIWDRQTYATPRYGQHGYGPVLMDGFFRVFDRAPDEAGKVEAADGFAEALAEANISKDMPIKNKVLDEITARVANHPELAQVVVGLAKREQGNFLSMLVKRTKDGQDGAALVFNKLFDDLHVTGEGTITNVSVRKDFLDTANQRVAGPLLRGQPPYIQDMLKENGWPQTSMAVVRVANELVRALPFVDRDDKPQVAELPDKVASFTDAFEIIVLVLEWSGFDQKQARTSLPFLYNVREMLRHKSSGDVARRIGGLASAAAES